MLIDTYLAGAFAIFRPSVLACSISFSLGASCIAIPGFIHIGLKLLRIFLYAIERDNLPTTTNSECARILPRTQSLKAYIFANIIRTRGYRARRAAWIP